MTSSELSAELKGALNELDSLLTDRTYKDPTIGSRLNLARLSITRALSGLQTLETQNSTVISTESLQAVMPYVQSLDLRNELGRNVYINHFIAPLPINETRLSLSFLYTDAFRKSLIDAVLATINDRRVNIGWFTEGGFDWERGEDYFELRNAIRRGPTWQLVRVYDTGTIAYSERWTEREAYPSTRFERFLDATLSLSDRVFNLFPTFISHVGVNSEFMNAVDMKLAVPGIFAPDSSFIKLKPKQSQSTFYIHKNAQLVTREQLRSESKMLSSVAEKALRTKFELIAETT